MNRVQVTVTFPFGPAAIHSLSLKKLPALTKANRFGALQVLLLATLLLVGRSAELGAWYYGGLAAAAMFGLYQQALIKDREPSTCFRAFLNNAWFGGAVFCGIALDYLFRA